MKTRERSAAGGGSGRQSVPSPTLGAPGGGDRLPMAPRERKPALAALAVLLILLGALGATVMVLRAGDKITVVEINADVAQGQPIPAGAVRSVDISDVSGLDFIRWNQRANLASSFVAATNLKPGTVLVRNMITPKGDALASGTSLVGLSLKEGQYPTGLKAGDTVAAYLVGNNAGSSTSGSSGSTSGSSGSSGSSGGSGPGNTEISDHLVIKTFATGASAFGDSGNVSVTVLADNDVAGPLTIAASANDVALVLVPSKN